MLLMLFFKCSPLVSSIGICSARNYLNRGSLTPKCTAFSVSGAGVTPSVCELVPVIAAVDCSRIL